jgi:hypothetical protein
MYPVAPVRKIRMGEVLFNDAAEPSVKCDLSLRVPFAGTIRGHTPKLMPLANSPSFYAISM